MKKIVSAALVASLVAGAFAADAKITLNARSHYTAFEKKFVKDNSTTANDTTTWSKFAKSNDSLGIELKNDYAGAHVDLALNNAKDDSTGNPSVAVDTKYWGWMSWGKAKVTAGVFESIFTKRGNTTLVEEGLTDDGNIKNYGLSKILKINGTASGASFLTDANNIGANCGDRVWSMVGDYTVDGVADGKLLIKAGVVDSTTAAGASGKTAATNAYRAADAQDKETVSVGTGYALVAALQRDDFSVETMVRTTSYKNVATGIYFTAAKLIPSSTAMVGFTYGSQSKKNDNTNLAGTTVPTAPWDAWAIDVRFSTKPVDKVQFNLIGKYENLKVKKWADEDAKAETGLYVAGQIGYEMSDLINLALDAGVYMCDLDDNDKKDQGENYIKVRPAVEVKAGKGARITTALEYTQLLNTGDIADTATTAIRTIAVPVIFRVKM